MIRRLFQLWRLAPIVVLLFGVSLPAVAAWRTAGDVVTYLTRPNGVHLILSSGALVDVTLDELNVVRVRLAPRGRFERDQSYAVEANERKAVPVFVRDIGRLAAIEITAKAAGGAKVVIQRKPFLVRVYDASGQMVVEDDAARPVMFDQTGGAL